MRFKTLENKEIKGDVLGFSSEELADKSILISLNLKVDFPTSQAIMQGEYFNLFENLNYAKPQFDEHNPVVIELGIVKSVAAQLVAQGADDAAILSALDEENTDDTYALAQQNQSWQLLSMTQEIDLPEDLEGEGNKINIGFKTAYHSDFENSTGNAGEEDPINAIKNTLAYFELDYSAINETTYRVPMKQAEKEWTSVVVYQADHKRYVVFSFMPTVKITAENSAEVITKLNEWNANVAIGTFFLNKNLEFGFRTSAEAGDSINYSNLFKTAFTRNSQTMTAYYDDVIALGQGVLK